MGKVSRRLDANPRNLLEALAAGFDCSMKTNYSPNLKYPYIKYQDKVSKLGNSPCPSTIGPAFALTGGQSAVDAAVAQDQKFAKKPEWVASLLLL